MKLCEKCNKINIDSATNCKYCGESLDNSDAEIPFGFKVVTDLDNDNNTYVKQDNYVSNVKTAEKKNVENNIIIETIPAKTNPTTKSEDFFKSKNETPVVRNAPLPSKTTKEPIPFENKDYAKHTPAEPVRKYIIGNNDISHIESPGVKVRPMLEGTSISYKSKIDAYGGIDRLKCSKCGSYNISLVSNTQKKGFSSGNACCGYLLLGPLGILCGSLGSNKTKTTEYWVCGGCGNHFQSSSGNAEKEKVKRYASIISHTPDNTTDNVDRLLKESTNELNQFKELKKAATMEQYKINNKLKLYAIISLSLAIIMLILSILFIAVLEVDTIIKVIMCVATIGIIVGSVLIKPIMENKFGDENYITILNDIKDVQAINKRLNDIEVAKKHLQKLRVI